MKTGDTVVIKKTGHTGTFIGSGRIYFGDMHYAVRLDGNEFITYFLKDDLERLPRKGEHVKIISNTSRYNSYYGTVVEAKANKTKVNVLHPKGSHTSWYNNTSLKTLK